MCWCARPAAGTQPRADPQRAEPSCCAAHCEAIFSTARLHFLTWIEQPVEMNDEIAHVGVVDGLLRLCLPRRVRGRVVREHADDFDLVQIPERRVLEIDQFAADDEMQQLRLGTIWHDSFPYCDARQATFPTLIESP